MMMIMLGVTRSLLLCVRKTMGQGRTVRSSFTSCFVNCRTSAFRGEVANVRNKQCRNANVWLQSPMLETIDLMLVTVRLCCAFWPCGSSKRNKKPNMHIPTNSTEEANRTIVGDAMVLIGEARLD